MRELKRRVWDFLVGQDCWYLLSGFLMLLGCFLMSQAPGADSVELAAGLRLQSVVLLYQVAVVGLAIFVRRKLRVENDAFNLACVALVLLPDPTFFSTRFWGHSRAAGMSVNGGALVASVLLLVLLAELGRFPLKSRAMAAWITLLTAVYGAGWFLEPGQTAGNGIALDAIALLPLVLAALAAPWDEGSKEESRQASLDPRLAKHPVLWGDPGRIYRRYFAAIVLAYPVMVMMRHLYGLSCVFGLDLDGTRLAPFLLAVAVLSVKTNETASRSDGWLGFVGALSLLFTASRPTGTIPMFVLMAAANLVFGLWVHHRRGGQGFPAHAVAAAVALAGGQSPSAALQSICTLSPGPLALFVVLAAVHAWRDGGFWEIWGAAVSTWLLALRLSPFGGAECIGVFLHGAGFLYLGLIHFYPRKDLYPAAGLVSALMLMSLLPAVHGGGSLSSVAAGALGAETMVFFLAGLSTPVKGYLLAAIAMTLVESFPVAVRALCDLDVTRLFWTWGGPAAILLAFATLALGLAGSSQRAPKE